MEGQYPTDPQQDELGLDLLSDSLFSLHGLDTDPLCVSELDMVGLEDVDMLSDHNLVGDTEPGAVTQLEGWPTPVITARAGYETRHTSEEVSQVLGDTSSLLLDDCDQLSLSDLEQLAGQQEGLEEDFQKMLTEWETHISSLSTSSEPDASSPSSPVCDTTSPLDTSVSAPSRPPSPPTSCPSSPAPRLTSSSLSHRQLPVSSGLRSPVLPRPGTTYTRVAGLGPRITRVAPTSGGSPYVSSSGGLPARSHLRSPSSPLASPPSGGRDWFLGSSTVKAPAPVSRSSSLLDTIKFSNCTSDLSTTRLLENQKRRMEWLESNFHRSSSHTSQPQGKIIAAVSPGRDGGAATTRILSSRSVKDTLPRELIEKIKAASQGRKTIAIIEPVPKDGPRPLQRPGRGGWHSSARWRHVGVVSPLQHNISDHDYCSPNKAARGTAASRAAAAVKQELAATTLDTTATEMVGGLTSPSSRGRDSGLESAEMSDASEDGGLYDKLPPYLTSVSVQTDARSMTAVAADDHGYTRIPTYISTTSSGINNIVSSRPAQQSLLKSNLVRVGQMVTEVVGESHNLVRVSETVGEVKTETQTISEKVEAVGEPVVVRRRGRRERSISSSSDDENCGRSKRRRSRSPRIRLGSRRRSGSRERRRSRNDRSRSSSRRHRRGSRGGFRSKGRVSSWSSERKEQPYDKEREKREQERRHRVQERQRQVEERRVVYVGRIQEGTLKDDLRKRFQVFGPIVDISVHFRDFGDNYGFVTFQYKVDAYAAVEHGNDDASQPNYDLCFGGRRAFCKEKYFDLDDVEDPVGSKGAKLGFDELLEHARGGGGAQVSA